MGRPTTKTDLLNAAAANWEKMNAMISSLTEMELSTPFNFTDDVKKKEAHWRRDKNLKDILIHLYEWHMLLIDWIRANRSGIGKTFIPEPYNWKTYGDMNLAFWEKHRETSLEEAKRMLAETHERVMSLAEEYSNEELFSKGVYPWVGGSTLGSYFVSVTASHYDWAMKKIKAHIKNCKSMQNNTTKAFQYGK